MRKLPFLSLVLIISLAFLWSCSDSTGSSGTDEITKPPAGQWVFVKDSVITVSEYNISSMNITILEDTHIDTTVEHESDTTEIYVTTDDSITVWVNADTATLYTTYENDLTFGSGILSGVTVDDIEKKISEVADSLALELGALATDIKIEIDPITISNPTLKQSDNTLQIIYTAKTVITISGNVENVPQKMTSNVTSTNYATYQKYTGDVPPASWPQNQIKVD